MGSESSKPTEETPENWENGNSFQIISPRSDLSNPSDIHRFHRPHVAATSAHPDRNRRVSKTITNSMNHLPQPQNKLPPPQALYFPTTETERTNDRLLKDTSESNKENGRPKRNLRKIFGGCFAEGAAQIEMEKLENKIEQTDNVQKKPAINTNEPVEKNKKASRKKNSKGHRISDFDVKASAPCPEMTEDSHKGDGRRSSESNQRSRKEENRTSKDGSGLQDILSSMKHSFVIREAEGMVMPNESFNNKQSEALGIATMAVHQEEDYFARLTTGPSGYNQVQHSPVVQGNEALNHLPSALDNVATVEAPDSPVSNLFAAKDADAADDASEIEDKPGNLETQEREESHQNSSVAPTAMTGASELGGNSVVDSLQKFHTQILLNSAPEMSTDDSDKSVKVFLDETHDSSEQGVIKEISEDEPSEEEEDRSTPSDAVLQLSELAKGSKINEDSNEGKLVEKTEPGSDGETEDCSDEDSALLTYFRPTEMNAVAAFRPKDVVPDQPLKQIAALGPSSKNDDKSKKNKLESLFRPVLPSLSVDDATTTSYDPYEIKVTESAPGAIESRDYRALALRPNYGSPESSTSAKSRQLATFSPSMMSIDSHVDQSPARTQVMVSDQALCNAEFLFSSDYKMTQKRIQNDRDSAMFSISTLGARSRMSQRSTRIKPVKIPSKGTMGYISDVDDEESSRASNSERRVRFSGTSDPSNPISSLQEDGIDMAVIERKVSDLTDSASEGGSRASVKKLRDREFKTQTEKLMDEDKSDGPETGIHWEYTTKDGVTAVTPHRKGNSLKNATNSPYLRYQAAKSNYETAAQKDIPQETHIEIPAIESKVSDLTESLSDFGGRLSHGSVKSATIEDTIPEESEFEEKESNTSPSSSPPKLNWSYSEKDGVISAVTPHLKGRSLKNATNSPFLRFKNAKNTFGTKSKESLPIKSPKTSKTRKSGSSKAGKRTSGGVVSSRIEALNRKVRETRKLRRLSRRTSSNPRVHPTVETNVIRTRAIMTYRTDVVGIEKRNYMGAAKFNRIPIDDGDDDLSVDSSRSEESVEQFNSTSILTGLQNDSRVYPTESIDEYSEQPSSFKDDASGMTEDRDDLSRLSEDAPTVATVPTVRQTQEDPTAFDIYSHANESEGRASTASSHSFSNVRRQVFRGYDSIGTHTRQSMASNGESTTLSSILQKENSHQKFRSGVNAVKPSQQAIATAPGALHLSPTQRTPMEARKWRSLAAAAKEKDALKRANKPGGPRARKGLSERNANTIAI